MVNDPIFDSDDPSDAALDQLLAQARWPIADEQTPQRHRHQWAQLSRRHASRRSVVVDLVAVAAVALLLAGVSMVIVRERMERISVATSNEARFMSIVPDTTPLVQSRPANLSERLMLSQSAPSSPAPLALVRPPDPEKSEVDVLLEQLNAPKVETRFIAAQALAQRNEPQIVQTLAAMVQQGVNAREALIALQLSTNPLAAETLDQLPLSPASRAQLAADTRSLQLGYDPSSTK